MAAPAVRAVAMLPLITGAWKQKGGGLQLSTSGAFPFNSDALQMPELAKSSPIGRLARTINMSRLGHALTELGNPTVGDNAAERGAPEFGAGAPGAWCRAAGEGCVCLQLESRGGCAQSERRTARVHARRSVYGGPRAVLYRHGRLRRRAAARGDVSRSEGCAGCVRALVRPGVAAGDSPVG